jgi:SlyX protein
MPNCGGCAKRFRAGRKSAGSAQTLQSKHLKFTTQGDCQTQMNDEALERIQTRIAFLERANTELSDVVVLQQRDIQALTVRIKEILERLDAAQSEGPGGRPEDERPPHY